MSAADTPLAAEPSQPKLSEMERVTNIFVAPSKTFEDIKRSANWLLPFVLMAIMSLIYVEATHRKVGWDQVVENKFNSMSEKQKDRLEQLPADTRARQAQGMKMGFQYGSYAAPVFFLIIFAVIAAIYMAAFNFGLGAEVSYKHSLAVLMYASLPGIIRTILAVGTVFMISDPSTFNFENPVVTNPGFLFSESASPALYGLFSKIDVFALWSLYLTALGFSCVAKIKRGAAMGMIFGLYGAYALVGVLFSLAFK